MPLPSLQEIYEKEKQRYDSLKGKYVKIHTDGKDMVEGIWEDITISMNEAEHQIAIWSITLSNKTSTDTKSPGISIVLAEIEVIEVIEDEDDPITNA